ncbi:hypothetical protein JCM5350_001155 [Sporobolomyces pararoseus]
MNETTPAARRELGLLILVVLKAQHLPDPHKFSKQDPFVIAELGEGENLQTVRTQTDRGGGQHPLWDEEFRMKLYEEEGKLEGQRLTLKVMRKEGTRAKDEELIGEGSVLVDGMSWREFDEWIELKTSEGKYVGEVYVEMTFYPLEPQRRPSASNLVRHPSRLDPSTRAPVPPSLQPGSLRQSLSSLSLDDRYNQQAPAKELPTIPLAQTAQPELLPFPGDPEPSHSLPTSLRPGSGSSRPSSIHNVPTISSESLPLPGEDHRSQSYGNQQQYLRATQIPISSDSRPSLLSHDSNPSLSSSPGQISYSPLVQHHQAQQHQLPSSYPFLAPSSHHHHHSLSPPHPAQPQSISYPPPSPSPSPMHSSHVQSSNHHIKSTIPPVSPPPVPPRPSSAASSITEIMPGSFNPHPTSRRTPSPSPNRFSNLSRASPDYFVPLSTTPLPARQHFAPSPSPSPSSSQFPPSSSNSRPPLPPTPAGAFSTPSFVSKHQEAASEQEQRYVYSSGPPAYQPPPPTQQAAERRDPQQEEESESRRVERLAAEREAREAAERERILEEERARKERERISEEKKLARIREAQEARAKKLAQEKEDERLALEAEARERAAESERRERERQANEDFIRRLQDEEREREERERRDEEFARKMREEEEAERLKREKADEEFVRKLREEDQRAEEEERQRRLVEDERLARSLAERENEEQERRRNRPP